jgi:hypothetical protein
VHCCGFCWPSRSRLWTAAEPSPRRPRLRLLVTPRSAASLVGASHPRGGSVNDLLSRIDRGRPDLRTRGGGYRVQRRHGLPCVVTN